VALALSAVAVDRLVTDRVGLVFDTVFVLLCVVAALSVRPRDFFTVGVLPPMLMLGVFVLLGIVQPESIAQRDDGAVQAVVSGLSHHAGALVAGYVLCLGVLAVRQRVLARAQAASKRAGSPAPTRTTWG
jgi:hypothetical protein